MATFLLGSRESNYAAARSNLAIELAFHLYNLWKSGSNHNFPLLVAHLENNDVPPPEHPSELDVLSVVAHPDLQEAFLEECRQLQRRILELSDDPRERFFCRWKQLCRHYEACLAEIREAIGSLERMLEEEIPDGVQEKPLRRRLEELLQMQKKLTRDCEGRILLIRKTGDLQIELD